MSTNGETPAFKPPDYFRRVAENARRRWDQLEADPELAGPWRHLFAQVQSPRHVVSELLQNADDAGATCASARLDGNTFVFEHDGLDFDEATFGSLCRFGFSNKRTLHTIGFRGIGFKSTFSLGDSVRVATPSLSFQFDRARFTQPVWVGDGPTVDNTRIAVEIASAERRQEIQKNLEEWKKSTASLLFFRNIATIEVNGSKVVRRVLAEGPVDGSQWIELGDVQSRRLLLIKSGAVEFPEEAIREIKQERNTGEDFSIPPCQVEIVFGLPDHQRLYVVLPTGVRLPLQFSCNAPFIQDPARFGIKDPAISATNRWLLTRIGQLAAQSMMSWLSNGSLGISASVEAYGLLPNPPIDATDIAGDCAKRISEQFSTLADEDAILITTENTLVDKETCVAPPRPLYEVWTAPQLAGICGEPEASVLAREVMGSVRQRLAAWGWLSPTDEQAILTLLAEGDPPIHPGDNHKLLKLWNWVQPQYKWLGYGGEKRRALQLVPVIGSERLHASEDVVRLSSGSNALRKEDLVLLSSLVSGIDLGFIELLTEARAAKEKGISTDEVESALHLLTAMGLNTASPSDKVIAQAGEKLAAKKEIFIHEAVQLAQIAAVLDARLNSSFPFVTKGKKVAALNLGVVQDVNARAELLAPPEWADAHILHESYVSSFVSCTRQQWMKWSSSDKSGLRPLAAVVETNQSVWDRRSVQEFVQQRHSRVLYGYPFVSGNFTITDYPFDPILLEHWKRLAPTDPNLWVKIVRLLIEDQTVDWPAVAHADQTESTSE